MVTKEVLLLLATTTTPKRGTQEETEKDAIRTDLHKIKVSEDG